MGRIDLAGRPIAITGASSGIGRATALACAEAGMPVAIAARRLDRLEEIAETIHRAGGRAHAAACDVSDPEACRELVTRTCEHFGPIYAAFANAGFGHRAGALDDESALRELIEVNFFGSLHLLRPAVEVMRREGRGHALLCSSCLSKIAIPYYSGYTASKAMQEHIARALRMELRGEGIHVSSIHPIGTRTELRDRVRERSGEHHAKGSARFMQDSERVARAVVGSLRRPRGEVWTSLPARVGFSALAAMPSLAEPFLRRRARAGRGKTRPGDPD